IERSLRAVRIRRGRLDGSVNTLARPALQLDHAGARTSVVQRDSAPSHSGIATGLLRGREDMRAHGTIGVQDRDRAFPDWLKALPDIKALALAADVHRYWLEVTHSVLRGLSCCNPHGLC